MASSNSIDEHTYIEPLKKRVDGEICYLTLCHPKVRNALSGKLIRNLQSTFDEIANDRKIKVVVLDADGDVFCAGHDLMEIRALSNENMIAQLFADCSAMMQSITEMPQPVIALVQGIATAAGCQLVATADLAIASESARFATPGVHIGLFCSTPMVPISRVLTKKHAMEMLLTGDLISAEDALRFGLINRVVAADALQATGNTLARKIAEKSSYTVGLGKKAFYEQLNMPIKDAYAHCCKIMTHNTLAPDAVEGIDAFLQKRSPKWSTD